jgi:hypothetical protein
VAFESGAFISFNVDTEPAPGVLVGLADAADAEAALITEGGFAVDAAAFGAAVLGVLTGGGGAFFAASVTAARGRAAAGAGPDAAESAPGEALGRPETEAERVDLAAATAGVLLGTTEVRRAAVVVVPVEALEAAPAAGLAAVEDAREARPAAGAALVTPVVGGALVAVLGAGADFFKAGGAVLGFGAVPVPAFVEAFGDALGEPAPKVPELRICRRTDCSSRVTATYSASAPSSRAAWAGRH